MSKPSILKSNQSIFTIPTDKSKIHINIGDSLTINLYKKLMIHCHAEGLPKPKVVWQLNGKAINLIQNVNDYKNGSLLITSITWMHRGSFECFQMNPAGLDTASSDVKVYGKNNYMV